MEQELDLQTTYRAILKAARSHKYISYGELARANGVKWNRARFPINKQLGQLMELAAKQGWPIPSSIVVSKQNIDEGKLEGSDKEGFVKAAKDLGFNVQIPDKFIEEQQQKMFDWALDAPDFLPANGANDRSELKGPKFVRYFGPLLNALRMLGGSVKPRIAIEKVAELEG